MSVSPCASSRLTIVFLLAFSPLCVLSEPIDDLKVCLEKKDPKQRLICFDQVAPRILSFDQGLKAADRGRDMKAQQELAREAASKENSFGRDTLDAIKKMQARTRVGVSYKEYSALVGEMTYIVEKYLASTAAQKRPDFAVAIKGAAADYEKANMVWRLKFADRRPEPMIYSDQVVNVLLSQYPNMRSALIQPGILEVDRVLPVIWESASEYVKTASTLLGE